ncbi:site-specific integrase, partial [Klebsiella pneumoniae]|nr:site-specific integrase [Klebsiella pneumoniae]
YVSHDAMELNQWNHFCFYHLCPIPIRDEGSSYNLIIICYKTSLRVQSLCRLHAKDHKGAT